MQPFRLPSPMKSLLRTALLHSPEKVRALAARVPFSRFSAVARGALWGVERMRWRDCEIEINAGELHGYYVYMLGEYASYELPPLIEVCRDAKLFADVGANIGLVSLAVARACPGTRVCAFEPDRSMGERLQRNLALNPDLASRIELEPCAASDREGELHFLPSNDASNPETGHLAAAAEAGTIAVPAVRLDRFFEARGELPDVVKIDVEGAELQVLQGMSGLFERGEPRAMLIEVHGFCFGDAQVGWKRELVELLTHAGFALTRTTEHGEWLPAGPVEAWPDRCHIFCRRI